MTLTDMQTPFYRIKEADLLYDIDLLQTALSEKGFHGYDTLKDFTDSILKKINDVSLNPMQYVEKTIVAYKNPGHNFPAPYAASAYSGMMFNYYC